MVDTLRKPRFVVVEEFPERASLGRGEHLLQGRPESMAIAAHRLAHMLGPFVESWKVRGILFHLPGGDGREKIKWAGDDLGKEKIAMKR